MDPTVAAQLQSLKAKWAPKSAGGAAFSAAGAPDGSGVASVEQFELADQRRLAEGAHRTVRFPLRARAHLLTVSVRRVWPRAAKEAASGSGGGAANAPGDRLSGLVICRTCQGSGMVDEHYNHMVISKTCVTCDGDGIVPRPSYGAASGAGTSDDGGADAATTLALKRALGETEVDASGDDDDVPPLEDA